MSSVSKYASSRIGLRRVDGAALALSVLRHPVLHPHRLVELPAEHAAPESLRPRRRPWRATRNARAFLTSLSFLPLAKVISEASYCTQAAPARSASREPAVRGTLERVVRRLASPRPARRCCWPPHRPRSAWSAAAPSTSATRPGACSCCTAPARAELALQRRDHRRDARADRRALRGRERRDGAGLDA